MYNETLLHPHPSFITTTCYRCLLIIKRVGSDVPGAINNRADEIGIHYFFRRYLPSAEVRRSFYTHLDTGLHPSRFRFPIRSSCLRLIYYRILRPLDAIDIL